jgi:glycosyltransferase involved in cell wall biosynthesis
MCDERREVELSQAAVPKGPQVFSDELTATVSVVIPAHDEARVLGGTLEALHQAAIRERPHVVVVANGCSDATAQVARDAGATVVEMGAATKAGALRAGDELAACFPRVYLDADIRLSPGTLDELVTALRQDDVLVASPRIVFELEDASWSVRAFYRIYRELPYVSEGLIGLGVYGLSETGRGRFAEFPDVTSDDLFVQRLFAPQERATSPGTFHVAVPRDLSNLVKVRTRTAAGNTELAGADADTFERSTTSTSRALVELLLSRPRDLPAVGVYVAVTAVSRVLARRGSATWHRDVTTR